MHKDIVKGINLMKNMGIKMHTSDLSLELKRYRPYVQDSKPVFVDDYYGLIECKHCGKRKHKSHFRYLQPAYRRKYCKSCQDSYKHDHQSDCLAYFFGSLDPFSFNKPSMVVVDFGSVN